MYLKDIYVYPIKSLGGIRLEHAILREKGLQYDRRWMLVDESGRFLSQREHPQMALLQSEVSDQGIRVYHKQKPSTATTVPFEPSSRKKRMVTIWEDQVEAQLVDQSISNWFSNVIGQSCELVFMPSSTRRTLKPKYAVNGEAVSFADGMPYLLISQASLDDLNSRLDHPVSMDRFRPNIVVGGGTPYQEDDWSNIKIGNARFKITKPCARCVVTTINQTSAEKSREPLKTLATYRKVGDEVMFGQNMIRLSGDQIQVNDPVVAIS